VGLRVKQAGTAVKNTVNAGVEAAKDAGGRVVDGAKKIGEAGYNMLDQSGDGKLGVGRGAQAIEDAAVAAKEKA
jgi:hypothetical protein